MHGTRRLGEWKTWLVTAVALGILLWGGVATPADARSFVVSACASDADLRAKLTAMQAASGGTLTFACGAGATTIVLSGEALPTIVQPTIIDGGGRVTISGGNASRIFVVPSEGSLTLRRIRLTRGLFSGDGGAIRADGALTIESSTFEENQSTAASGGAIVAYGPVTIRNSRFENNKAVNGGAFYPRHGARVLIEKSEFVGNEAAGFTTRGGAILVWDGPHVTIRASRFIANESGYAAGAISITANSVMTITESLFDGNVSTNSGSAIQNDGTLLLERSLLVRNQNGAQGTGGVLFNGGNASVTNTTFTNNLGTAIDTWGTHTLLLRFATIANSQGYGFQGGYGILSSSGTTTMHNTIIAYNSPNCQIYSQAVLNSQGFNISSDDTCALFATGDMRNTDPLLSPLGSYGGTLESRPPQAESPAIDEGQCVSTVPVDQRGMVRPVGETCDIGAVEVGFTVWLPAIDK